MQGRDQGASEGCETRDAHPYPLKVLVPLIGARIEQREFCSGLWILDQQSRAFPEGARDAGQRQIPLYSRSSTGNWNNVIDMESSFLPFLGQTAVFAPARSTLNHGATEIRRNIHSLRRTGDPLCAKPQQG